MRLRHIPGSEEQIAESIYVVQAPEEKKGRWAQVFENENPIQVEVGMGKGKFLLELAKKIQIGILLVWSGIPQYF